MKEGAPGGMLNILSEDDVQRVHTAAVALLEEPGILCESQ